MGNINCGQQYLGQLLTKSIEYINNYRIQPGYDQVQYFYRCKDEQYFKAVTMNNNIMVPMWKDFNGDPRSPINGRIKGVFLGVDLYEGELPTASPFGDTRVSFPIKAIFKMGTNLYFTDFYCTVSRNHVVTLVLTKAGSPADIFCFFNLYQLNPFNNPFLLQSGNGFSVVKALNLFVEVFYTDAIDLNQLTSEFGLRVQIDRLLRLLGKGSSTPGGLPKNPNCRHCNPTIITPVTILPWTNSRL